MCSTASLRGPVDTLHIPMRLAQPVGPVIMPIAYRVLLIPRWFVSEGIVLCGHLIAPAGVDGFGYLTKTWGGALVASNHLCDRGDGAHARRTRQFLNGGELLDHFTDPRSFSYWTGPGVCVHR